MVVLAAISMAFGAHIRATVMAPGNWGLDRIDQRAGTDNTFTFGATGKGVNLYVIDTGVLGAHVDFQDRRDPQHHSRVTYIGHFCAAGGVPQPNSPEMYAGNDGYDGHGTHNASFAAGNTYGVAKDARISRCGPRAMTSMKDRTAAKPGTMPPPCPRPSNGSPRTGNVRGW